MKILYLDIPGLHLGYLGCYGNEWIATPTLDRLAAEGVVFDQHYADSLGVSCSPWSGRYDLPGADGPERPVASNPPLLSLLRDQGVAVTVLGPVSPADEDIEEGTALEHTLDEVVGALDRLAVEQHWLLWVNLPALLPPWEVPEDFRDRYFQEEEEMEEEAEEPLTPLLDPTPGVVDREDYVLLDRLQNTYAAAVTYLDTGLAVLIEELRERALLDELLLVVSSERGLALAEHGIVGDCHPWLHDELIHLPLIVRLPGAVEAGRRVSALTQPVDLFPTILQAFDLPTQESHGHALQPLTVAQGEEVRQYACTGWRCGLAVVGLRTPEWGFLLPGPPVSEDAPRAPQLYVKPDDRWEVNDVRQHHLDLVEHLEQTLRAFVEATHLPGPLRPPELGQVPGTFFPKPQGESSSPGDLRR